MKASVFVQKAKDIATNYKTLYVMGCFGAPLNSTNKKRYTSNHSYNKNYSRKQLINNVSSDTFGFDCVCLIKGILWGWNGDVNHVYGGAAYTSNGVPDVGANQIMKYCNNVSTDFKSIEIGEIVWLEGHVGIYIGESQVVECTPKFKNKVQITSLSQRAWKKHGKLKYIEYDIKCESLSKSITEIAKEVLAGKWGNGESRKQALIKAGYDYSEVQAKVNELLKNSKVDITEIAKEVLAGKWGNGESRKQALIKAGYDYSKVQAKVNELLKLR